ncbi:hypothetical protein ABVC71_07685 [Prevotella amnii]|uniref:Uncharacterized protein n=1 Tax=Prevotella amnii CRIS 21A-A TaxID=679191 RepID=E1GXG2_9BACT|nr:hypothetical protein [Prevotella amnii]EFN90672.1 hypothetical protein HMPREF9018_1274 [Prevotella amnii CRIS 21A-A]
MESIETFIALIIALVVGIILIKKITGCIFRLIVGLIMLGMGYWAIHFLGVV